MSADQVTGLLRAVLAALGGIVIGKGWVDATTFAWLAGGIVTLITAGWSVWSNRPAGIAGSAQALPGVDVTTTAVAGPAVAAAVAANK